MQDALLQFSDNQALTATAVSTNSIDCGPQNRNLADGAPMAIAIFPSVSADITTGDETYSVQLQTDDNAAFSSPAVLATVVLPAAQLKAGQVAYFGFPAAGTFERYLRLNYVLGGTTPSVTIDAYISPLEAIPKYNKYYASGYEVK